jgi:hypothetical protein
MHIVLVLYRGIWIVCYVVAGQQAMSSSVCDLKKLLLLFLFVFFYSIPLSAQLQQDDGAEPPVRFEFVKGDIELSSSGSFFNVIRLENRSEEEFSGAIRITAPDGWHLIGGGAAEIDLWPGEEKLIPFRISVPPGVLGGISYTINAELRSEDQYYDYTTAYVSIAPVSKWDFKIDSKNIYLSDFKPQGDFVVRLSNKGNTNEMIKLRLNTGDLLEYVNPLQNDSLLFVELPAFRDTMIRFSVRERTGLSYAEERTLINNWRASSIILTASTPEQSRSAGIRVSPLESQLLQDRRYTNSPLNIDLSLNNLLSSQMPKMGLKVNGRILFPESQQLQYNVGLTNIYFNQERNSNFDLYRQLRFRLNYSDKSTSVEMGDRMGTGELHTLNGQGIRAQHTLNDNSTFFLNVANNPNSKNIGVHTGYSRSIKGVALKSAVTFESKMNTTDSHFSYLLGGSFGFLRYHKVRINTATSVSKFGSGPLLQSDTTTVGFAYRLSYNYTRERFYIRLDNTNSRLSYLRNSGANRMNIRSVYKMKEGSLIKGNYYRNSYIATKYPYNFFFQGNENINGNGNIYYSLNKGNIIYSVGPSFSNSVRKYFNPSDGFLTVYRNLQPGLFGSVAFRTGSLQSIIPYIRLNSMFVEYFSEDPAFEPFKISGLIQYTAGLSYYDAAFKLSAYFSSGESSDIYRSVVVEQDPEVNQSFHLRPYYERFFKRETIRVSGYLNYSYYLPSMRENTIFNLTSDFYLSDGWRIFVSFNLYRAVRVDEEAGRVAMRDINMLTGIRKSFDIQQPGLKYYDLTIVGFNDQNGNGVKDSNEKPIPNVLIQITRDLKKNLVQQSGFSEISLITDPNGEIYYERIPEGLYKLNITALSNLEDLFFLNGENQEMEVHGDMIHYLPLVESYRIKGRVIVDRDPNSNEGKINLEGIRITAVSENGETYSALTDSYGSYVLSLPRATNYEVTIYNVFGERFVLEQGRFKVQFSANKTINLDFKFTEKRRQMQYREGEQFFDFNLRRE